MPVNHPSLVPLLLSFTLLGACVGDKTPNGDSAPDSEPAVVDEDGDGSPAELDCDDNNAAVSPGAAELCDGLDNNCDGDTDEGVLLTFYVDGDKDGYGVEEGAVESCEPPPGTSTVAGDCDDALPETFPGAPERCDGLDNSCDGAIDEGLDLTFYLDGDGDGYGAGDTLLACEAPSGAVAAGGDCDDADPTLSPADADGDGTSSCDGDCDDANPDRVDVCGYTRMEGDFDVFGAPCRYELEGVPVDGSYWCPTCDFSFDTYGVLAEAADCLSDFDAVLGFDAARGALSFELFEASGAVTQVGVFPASVTYGADYDVLSFYGYGRSGNTYGGTLNMWP
ncbi:putative metal-binding motif-containing protein [Myxococcota bacterium]|nr:putative metal-binding motif-containing protein [Myxococcota bacterium]